MRIWIPLLISLFSVTFAHSDEIYLPSVATSVQKFITENGHDMEKLQPSCATFSACESMHYTVKTYTFPGDAQAGFEKLISLSPNEIWDRSSRFEMEYDPESRMFLGKHDRLPEIKVGQVFFLELDILKKMQIPVAFEVVELNHETRSISFSYLKQNKSQGIQRITFDPDVLGFKVIHETRFQSESKFRDKRLYRFFHKRLLNDVWKAFGKRL